MNRPSEILIEHAERLAGALAIELDDARREVELLMRHTLSVDRAKFTAYPELIVEAASRPVYQELLARRCAGEPIAYLVGTREFYGRSFRVSPAVLIPRPETELLIDAALGSMSGRQPKQVLDIGTGSGCIAITLARAWPHAKVIAVDLLEDALQIARENANLHAALNLELRQGDCFAPVQGVAFDVIVSNPPYVAAGDAHLKIGDLRFEPSVALVGGEDGLALLERIIARAPAHMNPGACLALEHGYDQARAVRALLDRCGFEAISCECDLAGVERVSVARWPA
ncbi:MAG TPA: peptide chain release factor N(5)-glutamine methyltransferase [Burkholderiales bacterium]|nr:peptide chain release factor N(5)-glutamine methyltransferase [Burkholderiales bacterium]